MEKILQNILMEKSSAEGPMKPPSNVLRVREWHPLDAIFAPKNVAVIGATEKAGSVGRTLLWNLISNQFGGTVFPVNLKKSSVLGIKAYPSITAVPEPVDLAVIVTPSAAVPEIIRECKQAGVKGAIIISAGFKETGPEGARLEQEILQEVKDGKMRIIGPNCLGVMRPHSGLNATFAGCIAKPGKVGFISQSGALCTGILDWSLKMNVGFSAFISTGSMLDVNWGDLIDYLGDDPLTESIVIYMESIGDAKSFLSAARALSLSKPIIVIKAGRSEAAAKAAVSHTGALVGSDAVLDAAFDRCGVLRVNSIAELFYMAEVLGKQPRPKGPRLAILTNAGGPGVLATDAVVAAQGEMAQLSPGTIEQLNQILPSHWSHNNPVDVLGDAGPDRYAKAVEIVGKDPQVDGLLVVLTPQAMTDPTQTAEQIQLHTKSLGKPLLASWMGASEVAEGEAILNRAGIPTFPYPDTAARMFCYMWRYSDKLRSLYETPELIRDDLGASAANSVQKKFKALLKSERTLLTEFEAKEILSSYGIPVVPTKIARTETEAQKYAKEIGYPVVLKLYSESVTHKTDVGGVCLDLKSPVAVRNAFKTIRSRVTAKFGAKHFSGVTVQPMIQTKEGYELILGSSADPQFGPVLLFGLGGQLVEVFKDKSLALPPLNRTLARRMIEKTRIYMALKGVRGRQPVDLSLLEDILVRFSQMVVEHPRIKEIDINPLFVSSDQIMALDARIVLYDPSLSDDNLPKPSIRPYPLQYVEPWKLNDGTSVIIRPIRPEDEPLMIKFHGTLSSRSVYYRYFHELKLNQRVAHERLIRICFIDYDREMALVAVHHDSAGESTIIGVGRMTKIHGTNDAEVAFIIADAYQHLGLGTHLLNQLIKIAREEKIRRVNADILADNADMQKICKKLNFKLSEPESGLVKAELHLNRH